MAKRNEIAKKKIDVDVGTVTFTFADEGAPIVVDLSKVPETNIQRLALHGLSQKCGDSYAGVDSVAEAREAVLGVQEMLYSGEWSTRAPGEPRTAVLAEALARATNRTVDEAKAALAAMDEETRRAVSAHPGVKKARAEMALEKANAELANAPTLSI